MCRLSLADVIAAVNVAAAAAVAALLSAVAVLLH